MRRTSGKTGGYGEGGYELTQFGYPQGHYDAQGAHVRREISGGALHSER